MRHAADRAESSNLNPAADRIVANLAVVPLDSTGAVCFQTYAASDLVVDLQGWYPAGSDYHAVPLDAHRRHPHRSGHRRPPRAVPGRSSCRSPGANGVAANAGAVALNLTAVGADRTGWVDRLPVRHHAAVAAAVEPQRLGRTTPSPTRRSRPSAPAARCASSRTSTPTSSSTSQGWFPAGSSYHAFTPVRALDTREAPPAVEPGTIREVPIAGKYGVPAGATTVSVNVTAADTTGPAWVKVFPCGTAVPEASNNNTSPDRIVATQALVPIGANGSICLAANWTTDLVVDVQGYS